MTGGGTLGPVTPLLGVVEEWRKRDPDVQFSWIGTPTGPEQELIETYNIPFHALAAPKLSRHKPWIWPFIPLMMVASCIRAFNLLHDNPPDMIFSAGGFTSIPVVWVGWFMRIPSWIHQLDVQPGLANRIMGPVAKRVSVTWKESLGAFSKAKADVYGGLVRGDIHGGNGYRFLNRYDLNVDRPTVLVLGGGTGAQSINEAIEITAQDLTKEMNVVLLTGKGKMSPRVKSLELDGFLAKEFLGDEMRDALDAADVVVARAGMGTIAELVALKKATILIPIPGTHQEWNAKALDQRDAADVIWKLTPQILAQSITRVIHDKQRQRGLEQRIGTGLSMHAARMIVDDARSML